jgi:hypothetical protein
VTQSHHDVVLANFARQIRKPLNALEALIFYLDLIIAPKDARFHEQLKRMHSEIVNSDQSLRDGLRKIRDCFDGGVRSSSDGL